ncbi:hypothetical protein CRE_00366 [Caenorhabditis remanei]|uniref:DUF38 domain-containing protein n=2 Tax=Caenorhabditis remanei TaxID=31234 RepID=E3LER7_CAERE|nr:hypothetical protein CRE_00366 [Caenorhabditis remanei]
MPAGLTYPCLKVVIEFLDANKRTHITNRCNSSFKNVEQFIPFRVDYVHLQEKCITLNNIKFEISQDENQIEIKNRLRRDKRSAPPLKLKYSEVRYQNIVPGQTFSRPIPDEWKHFKSLFREIISKLLREERKNTLLNYFQNEYCYHYFGFRGLQFKFKVSNLECKDVQDSLHLVSPSSAPMNYIECFYPSTRKFRHNLIDSAKKLVINYCDYYSESTFELDNFPLHPNADTIFNKGQIEFPVIRRIVLNLKNNEYKVGVTLKMKGLQISVMKRFMDYAKIWLSAKEVKVDASLDE